MPAHLVSSTAANRKCPRCGAPVIAGYSEGVWVECDPDPVDGQLAELTAIGAGRATFDLMAHRELVMRGPDRLGRRESPVLAQHACPKLSGPDYQRRKPYRRRDE